MKQAGVNECDVVQEALDQKTLNQKTLGQEALTQTTMTGSRSAQATMAEAPPLVSLITPTYRAAPYLSEYLGSVLAQDYTALEFFLINDGSDDESCAIVQYFAPLFKEKGIVFQYIEQEHGGQAKAFNRALPLVTGSLLTWADSDDILHPQNISAKVAYMLAHDCSFVRSNALEFSDDSSILAEAKHSAKEADKACMNIFEQLFLQKTYCLAGCYMMKTDLFKVCYPTMQIPDSIVGQNLQMLLPAASRADCHYVDKVLLQYRRHADSHYHSQKGLQKQSARLKALLELLQALIPYCTWDEKTCHNLIDQQKKAFWANFRATRPVQQGSIT